MVELSPSQDRQFPHSAATVARGYDVPIIAAANHAAGWLFGIVGPFFWAAIVVMIVVADLPAH